uniref:hypothetical protein n=1 Tax=Castellaniella defragrans TaxID=75697 RepID=UPI003342018F
MTSAHAGVKYRLALTDKDPPPCRRADYIGTLAFDPDLAHTRGSLSMTVSYAFSDRMRVEFTPCVQRTATRDTDCRSGIP